MRLWHYELIPVLPRKQLLAQWRECCAIASNIANKGTPNHILVNKLLKYPQIHFVCYTNKILMEMKNRSYRVNQKSYERFVENMNIAKDYFCNSDDGVMIYGNIFPNWHNKRYFKQCFYNLQEKYDCGVLTDDEYQILKGGYLEYFNLKTKEDKE